MSWVISLLLAGVMFTSEGDLATKSNYSQTNNNVKKVIKLDETERFEQSYPLNANGRVSVSNINGSITVEAWDKKEVKLEAVKTADSRETLADVELQIDARPDSFSVETDYSSWKNRDGGQRWKDKRLRVDFRLMVPRGANLNEIESVNGSITLSNFTNYTKASAVNGQVKATNLRGTAILSTVNGTTEADFDGVQANSKISLSTVNGSVNLLVPSDVNATVKADTVNGNINNDFGLPVRKGQYVGRDLYGRIGNGEAQIKLESVNGGLSIKRKNDGRNTNPAVNLLPAKNKDNDEDSDDNDNDNDNDSDISIDSEKMNKDIEKSIKNSQKNTAKAVKQAEKELKKIQPEIAKITVEAVNAAAEAVGEAVIVISSEKMAEKLKEVQLRLKNANWVSPTMEEKTESFPVKSNPTITIDANNCSVFVRGWDKPEVKYSVRQMARNGLAQKNIEVKADKSDSDVKIKVLNDSAETGDVFNTSDTVRVEVFVPKKSNLRILTNREIRLEGVSGDIKLTGGEGAVNVRDADGKLNVSTSEGRIRLIGFRGEVEAKTDCGMMNLDGDFQKLSARTVEGTIILYLPEDANTNIESNRKDIQAEGVSLEFLSDGKSTSKWKVGKGGANFLLYTSADGKIFVRNKNNLTAE